MIRDSNKFSPFRARIVSTIACIAVAASLGLANVSSEHVTDDVIKTIKNVKKPERAYGWPLTWYWRVATPSPGTLKGSARPVLEWPLSRYSAARFAANLVMWLAMLTGSYAACHGLLRRYRLRLSWRPRLSTLVVLLAVIVPTVLSNLSVEISPWAKASYGWPWPWHWYFVAPWDDLYGWEFSAGALAADLVVWLGMLGLTAWAWEWFQRRYRPRLQFSLRTMLAAVALTSALCAWCAVLRERAENQDALIASAYPMVRPMVWAERWGPKWLDLVGAGRFRRSITGLQVRVGGPLGIWTDEEEDKGTECDEEQNREEHESESDDEGSDTDGEVAADDRDWRDEVLLRRLARLHALRWLCIDVGSLTPDMVAALRELRQVRTLWIRSSEGGPADIAWISSLDRLEQLRLEAAVLSDDLGCLTGLPRLKSLTLDLNGCGEDEIHEWLTAVGKLTQLRRLDLLGSGFRGAHLAHLSGLKNLTSLHLGIDGPGKEMDECLAAVGDLTQLERLTLCRLGGLKISSDGLAHLRTLRNLKSFSLDISCDKADARACLAAIGSLTQLQRLWLDGDLVSAGLVELAPLESLEELTGDNRMATAVAIESLSVLKRLRAVHIAGLGLDRATSAGIAGDLQRAIDSLRRSHPGIVIDGICQGWPEERKIFLPWLDWERFDDKASDLDSLLGLVPVGP